MMTKGANEASAFLAQFRTAYEFAQAVADMEPLDNTKKNLELDNQQLGKNRQILVDELAELRSQIDAEAKKLNDFREEVVKKRSTASVEAAEIVKAAHFEADGIVSEAKRQVELILTTSDKQLAAATKTLREKLKELDAAQVNLDRINAEIASVKAKIGA